ncbi:GrpB family protein [Candidatus Amarolinea aalborgensis]|uniref:GrpB family protein n=1 Tax=Candidatus Amarolinea aalborgensis TaxID=2249329 RepID=UPI003BFA0A3F
MKIILEDYQPGWVDAFARELAVISAALAGFGPAIEHIGSTAVEGLCAKPTIDILVGLRDDTQLDRAIAPMVGAGYTYFKKYEPAMPYRRLFARLRPLTDQAPPELIDVHDAFVRGQTFISVANIHVVVKDTPHWTRHLAFRDYLRAHSDVRDDYGLLKSALSRADYRDTNEYNAAKERFIQETQARALAWYERQHETRRGNTS